MHNQVILEGILVSDVVEVITQDGKITSEFIIEHASQVTEMGANRRNVLRIRVYAHGNQLAQICRSFTKNSRIGVVGYLSRHLKTSSVDKFELVLKAQALELLVGD